MNGRLVLPVVLIAGGLAALLGSWACEIGPASGPPPAAPPPSVAPLPLTPDLTPAVNKTYTTLVLPDVKYDVTIEAIAGDTITYDLATTTGMASPTSQTGLKVTKTNGVYWLGTGASPVTKDISTYPTEAVLTLPSRYQFTANKVTAADGTTYWFAQGILVKSSGPSSTSQLVTVK